MSTGKPVKTPADVQRVRNEYLEYIRKEAELEDRNLQINKQYLENGTLPASTQMLDTRTNAEKLADIEGLKNKIANDLSPIAEPMFARNIVDKVINSRLNINGKLLRYLSQNAPQIAEQLKKKYSIGIAGDANDVDIIVNFIESIFTETQGTMQSVQDYAKTITNITNQQSNILSVNDVNTMIMNLQDMIKRLQISGKKIGQQSYNKINEITNLLVFIKNGLPTQEVLNEMIRDLDNNILRENDPNDDADELRLLFKILESIPKPNIVFTQLDILNKIIDNKYDSQASKNVKINDALNKITDQFSDFINKDNVRVITRFINKWKQPSVREYRHYEEQRANELREQQNERERTINNAQRVYIVNPEDDAVRVRNTGQNQNNIVVQQPQVRDNQVRENLDINVIENLVELLSHDDFDALVSTYYPNVITNADLVNAIMNDPNYFFGMYGIGGLGIKSTKKPIYKRGRQPDNFVIFGKGVINQSSLDKGILTYKRSNKTNYNDLPSKRISNKLKGIINTIVGGGNPNYNDLSSLDESEKEYLYKICKKSNLIDRLTIPAPSKDKEEKDIHEFEVMKGQIMSGNDSKELVKKFKIHIMKMAKQGLLPRNEVNDILEQLVLLGY